MCTLGNVQALMRRTKRWTTIPKNRTSLAARCTIDHLSAAPRPSGEGIAVTVTVSAEFNMADALELITKLIAALHRSHYPGDGT